MEPLTAQEIEVMRRWIRQYYMMAGHSQSADMADRLCDMALASVDIPPMIKGLRFIKDSSVPPDRVEIRDGKSGRLVGVILNLI